jgi:hypothetical protein
MSRSTASICASTISVGTGITGIHAQRVLRRDRGDGGHGMAAEHGDGLDVRLMPPRRRCRSRR